MNAKSETKLMPLRLPVIIILLIMAGSFNALAQPTNIVTGRITNVGGEPLSGVSISEEGTSNVVMSNASGYYTIDVPVGASIVYSMVGFATQAIKVGDHPEVNVILEEDNLILDDVVVIGYGSQKKVNVIGSVVTVSGNEISASPVGNVTNAIAGKLPGAVVQQTNGEPGNDGASILIRGQATLGNTQPLVVVDGIPGRDLNSINPNDVESISILKDAAAGIYGARAANGVILVATKKGAKSSALNVNYNFYQGWISPVNLIKMADAATYAEMIREMQNYAGVDESNMIYTPEDIEKYKSGAYPWTHPNTDWFDAALSPYSLSNNHNLSASGGSEAINYFFSVGTQYDGGIFKSTATSYDRYNIKAVVDAQINEYLSIGIDLSGAQENKEYPAIANTSNFQAVLKGLPTSPAFYPNGLPGPDIEFGENPVVSSTNATGFNHTSRYRTNAVLNAALKIPGVEGLTLSSYYAYDIDFGQNKLFTKPWMLYSLDEPAYLAAGNTGAEDGSDFLVGTYKGVSEPRLTNAYDNSTNKTFNLKLDYTKTFGRNHVSGFVAYESSDYQGKGITAFRRYFISDQLPYLFAGGDAEKNNSETVWLDARVNYFGRLSYDYDEKYLFQFSFRRDGSLRFSKTSGRWGNFPSVLAGWNISKETFWKDHIKVIDFFKLKASWGKLGNDLVDPFQYLSVYGISRGMVFGDNQSYSSGLAQSRATNPNITWETAHVYNLGFESLWLSRSITFNTDFFYQRRSNILVTRNASVPNYTGLILPDENFGIVDNKGFELELGYTGKANDVSYSVGGNFAFARNKIIEFDEPAKSVEWQRLSGYPMGTQLLYKSAGIFRDEAHVNSLPHVDGARYGDIIIEDISKDGVIDNDDRIPFSKTATPEITYGLNFTLSVKAFTLTGHLQGVGNASRLVKSDLQGLSGNYFAYDADGRWTTTNTDASKPRAFDRTNAYWRSSYLTDYYLQNTAFLRLKTVQLSYDIPEGIQQRIKLKAMQVYVSAQNPFLIYSGNKITDPELGDVSFYPIMKTFAVGARITL